MIKELFRQPLQVLVPLDQPFTQMEAGERTLERIVAEPLLLQGEDARLRKVLEHLFLRRGLSVGPIMEIESIEGLKELVKRGCGVTLMPPALLWSPQMRDGLELLPIADVAEMFIFALVYRRITPLTITARQFIKGAIETTAAAQELFIRHGFGSTSMDAIAAAANVSKQTLYHYYQHKEALFIATMQHLVFEHTAQATFAELRETPMESLPQLEHSLLTWARVVLENTLRSDYVALVRVLIAEIPRFPSLGPLFFSVLPQEGGSVLRAL